MNTVQCIGQHNNYIAKVDSAGLKGYIDFSGKLIIPCQYIESGIFKEDLVEVYKSGQAALINTKGEKILKLDIYGYGFNEGRRIIRELRSSPDDPSSDVRDYTYYGFSDYEGKIVIKPVYAAVKNFSEGIAAAKVIKDDKWGFIDKEGKIIIQPAYDNVMSFEEGFAAIETNGKWGFIDTKGKIIIQPRYEYVKPFCNGFAAVKKNGKYGFIDSTGKEVIECKYDLANSFQEGLAAVNIGGSESFSSNGYFSEGGKWGYINETGKTVIPITYSFVYDFKNGIATVYNNSLDSLARVINQKEEVIIGPKFKYVGAFINGKAVARETDKYGYINKKGDWVIQPQFNQAFDFIKIK